MRLNESNSIILPPMRQLQVAPQAWNTSDKASAVLCLYMLPPEGGAAPAHILFTRRSTQLRSHSGQVSFPGGRREETDASPVTTALRESFEEIGLEPSQVKVLGSIAPIVGRDGRPIVPIVGLTAKTLSDLNASPDEVSEIFSLPWTCFLPSAKSTVRFNIFGRWRETPCYSAQGYQIWGLTAWMLMNLGIGEEAIS